MPLPKDPEKVDEWKKKVGFRTSYAKTHALKVVVDKTDLENMAPKDLIMEHAKIHFNYRTEQTAELVAAHGRITEELSKKNIKHVIYDKLDEVAQ